MNSTTQQLVDNFEEAIESLRNADSQNSNKGALLKSGSRKTLMQKLR